MGAEIFSVGTELLLGQIVDTNAAYLAQRLAQLGVDCFHRTTVGDNPTRLTAALRIALGRSDLILATGGLGPTEDDVTAAAAAEALGVDLVSDEASADAIRRLLAARGIPFVESHLKQARVPRGSRVLPNPTGTAPGFIVERRGAVIICLPGPPSEMEPMFEQSVAPYLRARSEGTLLYSRVLRFMGIGESLVEDRLKDLIGAQDSITIAPYAGRGEVQLRLSVKVSEESAGQAAIAPLEAEIRRRLGEYIVAADDESVENTVARLLTDRGLTLAIAESCTGGLISHRLTNIPGSSVYLLAGLVTYSDASKRGLLGVPEQTLAVHGAVSRETALEMAAGVRRSIGADVGLASTGIAGPTGGSETKPVGLVYVAVADDQGEVCEEYRYRSDRESVKMLTANAGLNLLRRRLQGLA